LQVLLLLIEGNVVSRQPFSDGRRSLRNVSQTTFGESSSSEVDVAWQGGEPTLMGLDFFKRSIALANKLKRPDQKLQYTIQTNGRLLDAEE
jgi:uncharacterized protein